MSFTKIVDCYLYTGLTEDAQACYDFKKFLVDNNVQFTLLHYNDDTQHQNVFDALNTWWDNANFTKFPIFYYSEAHPDLEPSQYPRKYFTSVDEMKSSNFLTDYQLGR